MKKRLINFFSETTNVLLMISIIIGIVLEVMFLDPKEAFTPPNEEDYKELHYLEEKIKSDFDNVYLIDNTEILINEEDIIIEITSQQNTDYKVSMKFDKNRNFIESDEICTKLGFETYPVFSLKVSKILLTIMWIIITIYVVCFIYAVICVIHKIFSFILKKITIIFKKHKKTELRA